MATTPWARSWLFSPKLLAGTLGGATLCLRYRSAQKSTASMNSGLLMALRLPSGVSTLPPLDIHQYQRRHTLELSPLPKSPMPYRLPLVSFFE